MKLIVGVTLLNVCILPSPRKSICTSGKTWDSLIDSTPETFSLLPSLFHISRIIHQKCAQLCRDTGKKDLSKHIWWTIYLCWIILLLCTVCVLKSQLVYIILFISLFTMDLFLVFPVFSDWDDSPFPTWLIYSCLLEQGVQSASKILAVMQITWWRVSWSYLVFNRKRISCD